MTWPPAGLPLAHDATDDTATETRHAAEHNTIGAAFDDIVDHLDPANLSRLVTFGTVLTGIGSPAYADPEWTNGSPEIVGTDLAVDGDDHTKVNVLADGKYATTATFGLEGDFSAVELDIYYTSPTLQPRNPFDRFPVPSVGSTDIQLTISFTAFLDAGSTISADAWATTNAGTWGIPNSVLHIERVA